MPRSEIEFLTFPVIKKVIQQKQLRGCRSLPTKELNGAVESTDYLSFLTNHDQTLTSLRGLSGLSDEFCGAGVGGPRSFTGPLLLERGSPEKCFPLFTKGNAQFSNNEAHSTQKGFVPPLSDPPQPSLPRQIAAQRLSLHVEYQT